MHDDGAKKIIPQPESGLRKKILVRAPACEQRIVLSFPFFHELNAHYREHEIHVVVDEEKAHAFKFLPHKFQLHGLPRDKRGLAGIHHFVVNLKDVFNVDLFFDLDNSFKSAFMGFNFRGRERVGLSQGMKRFLLNRRVGVPEHPFMDKQYLEILASVTGKAMDEKRYTPRDLIEVVERLMRATEELNPDFLLALIHAEDFDARFDFWSSIFSQFQGVGLKICLLGPPALRRLTSPERLAAMGSWPVHQPIEGLPFEDTAALVKALVTTKGVLTDSNWAGQLASYFGVESFVLPANETPPEEGECFVQRPKYVALGPQGEVLNVDLDRDIRPVAGVSQLVDLIHERFRI